MQLLHRQAKQQFIPLPKEAGAFLLRKGKNIFYVNSFDSKSVSDFKNSLFNLIKGDIINKAINNIKNEDLNHNPVLYHNPMLNFSKKINYKNI